MKKNDDSGSGLEFVIQYLKKNKNFLRDHPDILNNLNFSNKNNNSEKIIDLNTYRYKKIARQNDELNKQISEILKAGKNHMISQKRILKSSLKVLNTKSLSKLIDLIVSDLSLLLACDIINCFFTSNKFKHNSINQIDNKIATSYFRDKSQTNLNQNPKGILIFFPNKSKIIKSYILLKINYANESFIIALGSKNSEKFSKDQQVDLINYLINIIEIKLKDFIIE